jgi:hypothetical protein
MAEPVAANMKATLEPQIPLALVSWLSIFQSPLSRQSKIIIFIRIFYHKKETGSTK